MELKFTKTDEKVVKILENLYLRGYSFADVYDILNKENLLSVFARKIYEDIESSKKYIKLDIANVKEDYEKILNDSNIENLISTLKNVIDMLNNMDTNIPKKLILELENDINELKLIIQGQEEIVIPPNIENKSTFYKMLQNKDYNKLKTYKLTGDLLKGRNENNF